MITTGTMAKAERKNTICPTGAVLPRSRTKADIAANSSAEASLSPMPLKTFIAGRFPQRRYSGTARTAGPGIHTPQRRGYGVRVHALCACPGTTASFITPRWRVAFERRQRLDVDGDRRAVVVGELAGIAHHVGHWPRHFIVRRHAGRQHFGDVFFRPLAELELRDVRHPVLAIRAGAAGKAQAGLDGAEKVARRMTLGTVAGSVHQIGAPVPVVGLLRVGLKRQAVQEQQLPDA